MNASKQVSSEGVGEPELPKLSYFAERADQSKYVFCRDVCSGLANWNRSYGCGSCDPCVKATRKYSKAHPLPDRIEAILRTRNDLTLSYFGVRDSVFPQEYFPRAYRGAIKGGPPGCAFALGVCLKKNRDRFADFGWDNRKIRLKPQQTP